MDLREKVALVTGAGTGIGKAVALALMREGYAVALAGRRADKLEETASEGRSTNGKSLVVPTEPHLFRANPTRCFIPPESSFGYAVSNPSSPTVSSVFSARFRRSTAPTPRASSGASTFSRTESPRNGFGIWCVRAIPARTA